MCPLWVKSRHLQRKSACPLCPRKRTLAGSLFNQLIGTCQQLTWHLEAKRLCGREVDKELKVGRLDDW
jgi:hypothetical protein